MFQLVRQAQGPAFIIGFLLLLSVGALCGLAFQWLGHSRLGMLLACWLAAMAAPFLVRYINLRLSAQRASDDLC